MYNEGELDPVFSSCLQEAISKDELISVRSLCSPFSAYTEKALLSYAQSYSLVEYLLDNYGQDSMLDLLTILKQGSTYDEALTEVYGFDIDGLDALWRGTLALHTAISVSRIPEQSEGTAWQSHPALIAVLATLELQHWLCGGLWLSRSESGEVRLGNQPCKISYERLFYRSRFTSQ
jgi:hypothetical protein